MKRIGVLALCALLVACDRTPGTYLKRASDPKIEPGWTMVARKGVGYSFAVPPNWIPFKVDPDRLEVDDLFPSEPAGFQSLMAKVSRNRQALAALNGDFLNLGFALVLSEDMGHNLVLKTEGDNLEKDLRSIEAFDVLGREEMEFPIGKAIRIRTRMREASTQYHMIITGYTLVDGHTRYVALFVGLTGGVDHSLPTRLMMQTLRVKALANPG